MERELWAPSQQPKPHPWLSSLLLGPAWGKVQGHELRAAHTGLGEEQGRSVSISGLIGAGRAVFHDGSLTSFCFL